MIGDHVGLEGSVVPSEKALGSLGQDLQSGLSRGRVSRPRDRLGGNCIPSEANMSISLASALTLGRTGRRSAREKTRLCGAKRMERSEADVSRREVWTLVEQSGFEPPLQGFGVELITRFGVGARQGILPRGLIPKSETRETEFGYEFGTSQSSHNATDSFGNATDT